MKNVIKRVVAAGLVLGGLWASGCSDDDGGGKGGGDCGSVAATYCTRLRDCLSVSFDFAFASVERCELGLKAECEAVTQAPGSKVTAGQFNSCLGDTFTSCEAITGGTRGKARPASCQPPAGELADGASCYSDAQCQSTSCSGSLSACGSCQPLKRGKEGDPCTRDEACEDLLTCNNKGVCFKPQGAGASCADDNNECLSPLACSNQKKCEERGTKQAGEACDGSQQCAIEKGLICGLGSTCTTFSRASKGEACGLVDGAIVVCDGTSTCITSVCEANLQDGEACTDDGPSCSPPAECVSGTCTLPTAPTCK